MTSRRERLLPWLCACVLAAGCGDSGGSGGGSAGASSHGGETASGAAAAGGESAGGAGAGGGAATQSGTQLFATATLHHVEITVADEYLDTLDNDLTVRVPATIVYDGEVVTDAGLRKKGQSTLQPLDQKPSFSVKLDDTVAGQDIDGIERFALNNTVMDATYTSEPLSYLLYQRAGVPAPRTAHAIVTFNGEVKGIYVVVEAINKQFLQEHYGDGEGNLYEGPWDFDKDPAQADLKDIEDGRTRDDLIALTDAVNASAQDSLDAAIAPYADVDQLIDTIAIDMAFCLWDGYAIAAWNFYLYHVPESVPAGGRFVMLPHGADWPYFHADIDPMDVDFRPWGEGSPAGILGVRLTTAPFVDRYRAALKSIRDDAFDTGVLGARIDEIDAVLHTADASHPVIGEALVSFDAEVDTARAFVLDRKAFLDAINL
jgi:spore coat protein H